MTPNPFAPPRAEVADPRKPRPEPPPAVRRACRLVIASMLLGWVLLVPGLGAAAPEDAQVPFLLTFVVVAFFSALTLWLLFATSRGAPWARWALLAYLLLGWLLSGLQFNDEFLRSPVSGMIEIVCVLLELVATWLLFTGSGAAWFASLALARASKTKAP